VIRPAVVAKRVAIGIGIVLALVYVGDALYLRLRVSYPKLGDPFGSVLMDRLYAIPQKNGKIDYEFDVRQPQVNTPCAHSLLPHMGYQPCWYLQRNSQKPIPM
jgi:hypothetical protein